MPPAIAPTGTELEEELETGGLDVVVVVTGGEGEGEGDCGWGDTVDGWEGEVALPPRMAAAWATEVRGKLGSSSAVGLRTCKAEPGHGWCCECVADSQGQCVDCYWEVDSGMHTWLMTYTVEPQALYTVPPTVATVPVASVTV